MNYKKDNIITIKCVNCGKILFKGTEKEARHLIIYCVDCARI